MMANRREVLKYFYKKNWVSFPCKEKSKHPAVLSWKGINQSVKIKPQQNIALLTGSVSGVCVIDIDNKNNGLILYNALKNSFSNGKHPKTQIVKTGGGGYHIYVKHTEALVNSNSVCYLNGEKVGIDIRCDKGYVMAATSVHPNGSKYVYEQGLDVKVMKCPDWLLLNGKNFTIDANGKAIEIVPVKGAPAKKREIIKSNIDWTPEKLENVITGLNRERFNDLDAWINLCYACHNISDEPWVGDILEKYCELFYDKDFKPGESRAKMLTCDGSLTSASILYWLKIDNVELYHELKYDVKNLGRFDYNDDYSFIQFMNEYNGKVFKTFKELDKTMAINAPRAIAYFTIGDGLFIKRTKEYYDMTRKLGLNDFVMYAENYLKKDDELKPYTISQWLVNNKNKYEKLTCQKNLSHTNKYEFNVFTGIKAKLVDLDAIDDDTKFGLEMWKELMLMNWASEEPVMYDYLISWFRNLFHPDISRTNIALAMIAKQGVGKNTVISLIREFILGFHNVKECTGIDEVVGNFNGHLEGVLWVIINEMASNKDDFRKNFDKLKSNITDDTLSIHKKGFTPYDVPNITSYTLLSNHDDSISVEDSDRRYAITSMNTWNRNNIDYFGKLRKAILNQDVGNAIYTYCMQYENLVNVMKIPDTKLKRQMIELSMANPLKFLKFLKEEFDMVNDDESDFDLIDCFIRSATVKGSEFYLKYREWCVLNGERPTTNTKFGITIKNNILKKRTKTGMAYDVGSIKFG